MKKQIIIFKIHSVADVITNSSSELFIIHTKKNLDAVKSILSNYLDKYNSMFENDEPIKWEQVWTITETSSDMNALKTIISMRTGNIIHPVKGNISPMTFKEFVANSNDARETWMTYNAYKEYKDKWVEENAEIIREALGNLFLVESVEDSSIPFEMVEWLQDKPLFAHYYRTD